MRNQSQVLSQRKKASHDARKQAALKSTKFSRYLMMRYSIAGFFFANLYWLVAQILEWSFYGLIPIVMLILSVLAAAEQLRMYGTDTVYLSWTKVFFQVAFVLQMVLIGWIYLTDQLGLMFPVFSDSIATKLFLTGLWSVGIVLAYANLHRIALIANNKDKAYHRIKQLEKFV
ncbi:hypothetical protein [Streptococcus merionis]|uniref:PTS transporter n=2 Tax=Streptococcus merionis TaxID=400065 RepID=A0A239SU41_9STRE|nr:PTS transporter [Streptococcus merionis]